VRWVPNFASITVIEVKPYIRLPPGDAFTKALIAWSAVARIVAQPILMYHRHSSLTTHQTTEPAFAVEIVWRSDPIAAGEDR
jgi:hypothetical protein